MSGLMFQAAKILSGKAVSSLFSLTIFAYIVRQIPKKDWAVVATFEMFLGILAILANYGISSTLMQRYPAAWKEKDHETLGRLNGLSLVALASGVLISLLSFLCMPFGAELIFKEDAAGVLGNLELFPLFFFPNYLILLSEPYFVSTEAFGTLSALQSAKVITEKLLAFFLFLFYGLQGYLWGMIAGGIILAIVYLVALRRHIHLRIHMDVAELVRYTFPFYLRSLFRAATQYSDQMLVGILLTPEILAMYSVARRVIEFVKLGIASIADPIMVGMAKVRDSNPLNRAEVFDHSRTILLRVFIPTLAFCISFSPLIVLFTAGRSYLDAWLYLVVLSLSLIPGVAMVPYISAIFAHYSPKYIMEVETASGLSTLLCSVVCILAFGSFGIAMSQVLGNGIGYLVARNVHLRLADGVNRDHTGMRNMFYGNLFIGSALAAVVVPLSLYTKVSTPVSLAAVIVGVIAFMAVNYLVLPQVERLRLTALLRRHGR